MKYQSIVIDVFNLYYRSYRTLEKLTTTLEDGTKIITGGIFGFLRSVKKIRALFGLDHSEIYFLFDNATSRDHLRQMLDPEYKANRTQEGPGFIRGMDFLQLLLLAYDDHYVIGKMPGMEADDLSKPVTELALKKGNVLLVSGDQDWARLISEKVHRTYPSEYQIETPESFLEKNGFSPTEEAIKIYKSFRGDETDNIKPGLPGIHEKDLLTIIHRFQDIYAVIAQIGLCPEITPALKKKVQEHSTQLRTNYQLVDFIPISESVLKEHLYRAIYSPKKLLSISQALGLDLWEVDDRIPRPEEKPLSVDEFFTFSKIPRL